MSNPFLKGKIRGAHKTMLGTSMNTSRGQALNASNESYNTSGSPQEFAAVITEVLQKDMGGEKVLFPFVKVMLINPGGTPTKCDHWLKITNSPDEIDTLHGTLAGVQEQKPTVKVRFASHSRRIGYVTLGTSSGDFDDYGGGMTKEYEGVQIV